MAETHEIWIYRANGDAEVRTLPKDAKAPDGWSFDPKVIRNPERRTADAASQVRNEVLRYDTDTTATDVDAFEALLKSATDRVAVLEAIITTGKAENDDLRAEIASAEEELAASAGTALAAISAKDDAEARAEGLAVGMATLQVELDRARAAPADAAADIAKLQAALDAEREQNVRLQGLLDRRHQRSAGRQG